MELLEGENLRDLILRSGALPVSQILEITSPVVEALFAAHEHGIIHRDIKPANIFVTSSGRVKLLDFGLAKMAGLQRAAGASGLHDSFGMESQHSGGWALGTIAYMSPEQALGKPLDERTDLFSLGAVLYEMATGEVQFKGDTTGMVFLSVVQEVPVSSAELNPDIPPELNLIVQKCLEKDAGRRYQHATEVLEDLKQATTGRHPCSPDA